MPGADSLRGWCASRICFDVRPPVNIHPGISLPSSLRMGPHAGIGKGTSFLGSGTVSLGPHVTMGPQCLFITGDHPIPPSGGAFRDHTPVHADIVVEEDVFLGARVVILPGVTIGRGAAVGAGSVVTRDVPAEAIVAGNPARMIRSRERPDRQRALPIPRSSDVADRDPGPDRHR
jgi:maltose O-acetyltransferase